MPVARFTADSARRSESNRAKPGTNHVSNGAFETFQRQNSQEISAGAHRHAEAGSRDFAGGQERSGTLFAGDADLSAAGDGESLQDMDRAKQVELLKEAFQAAANMPEGQYRTEQQHGIVRTLNDVAPSALAEHAGTRPTRRYAKSSCNYSCSRTWTTVASPSCAPVAAVAVGHVARLSLRRGRALDQQAHRAAVCRAAGSVLRPRWRLIEMAAAIRKASSVRDAQPDPGERTPVLPPPMVVDAVRPGAGQGSQAAGQRSGAATPVIDHRRRQEGQASFASLYDTNGVCSSCCRCSTSWIRRRPKRCAAITRTLPRSTRSIPMACRRSIPTARERT